MLLSSEPGCHLQVAHLIERCIQVDPGKRPAMSDVLEALRNAPTIKQVVLRPGLMETEPTHGALCAKLWSSGSAHMRHVKQFHP